MAKKELNKKEQLLETALKLYVTEGLAVPNQRVAKEANVASPIMLDCYPEKQDLVDALYIRIQDGLDAHFLAAEALDAGETREVIGAAWEAYMRWAIAKPMHHLCLKILVAPGVVTPKLEAHAGAAFRLFTRAIDRGIKKGTFIDIGYEYISWLMMAQIDVSLAQAEAYRLSGKTLDGHIQLGFGMFWNGIAAQSS